MSEVVPYERREPRLTSGEGGDRFRFYLTVMMERRSPKRSVFHGADERRENRTPTTNNLVEGVCVRRASAVDMMAVEEPPHADLREPADAPGDAPEDAPAGWFSENSGSGRLVRAVSGLGGWFSGASDDDAASRDRREAHAATVEALLERFGSEESVSRDSLARFSAARGDELDAAASMVEKHLAWRAETFPIDAHAEPGVASAVAAKIFSRAGVDNDGRPVLVFAASQHRASDERDTRDVIRAMTLVMEAAVREAEERRKRLETASNEDGEETENADRKQTRAGGSGASRDASSSASPTASPKHPRDDSTTGRFSLILFAPYGTELDLRLVAALASTFQDNYPERLHRLYALPTGTVTRVVWEAVRPFLSRSVAGKVVLASGGRRPAELRESMPLKTLREAIVALDPMDEGEEDPWDGSEEEREEEEARDE